MKKQLNEFKKYVDTYNLKIEGIKYKYDHSIRVMKIGNTIAKKLKLNNTETYMITLACLLHDIGRFDQLKIYNTFNDKKSFDHGDYAVNLIVKNNYLRKYIDDTTYDLAILKAIKNHNKYEIEECNEKELLFSKILRDADKIDILLNGGIRNFNGYDTNDYDISDLVFEKVMNEKCIDYNDTNNKLDIQILLLAFIFDINYKYSIELIKGKGIIKNIVEHIKSKSKNNNAIQKINIIENKIEEYMERKYNNG